MNELDPNFLGSTPIFHGELFPRPADQIKIWDFLAGKPIKRISLTGSNESELELESLFKFLDSAQSVESGSVSDPVHAYSSKKKSDERRIYSLKYDQNNPNHPYPYLIILIFGVASVLYYVNLIKM